MSPLVDSGENRLLCLRWLDFCFVFLSEFLFIYFYFFGMWGKASSCNTLNSEAEGNASKCDTSGVNGGKNKFQKNKINIYTLCCFLQKHDTVDRKRQRFKLRQRKGTGEVGQMDPEREQMSARGASDRANRHRIFLFCRRMR